MGSSGISSPLDPRISNFILQLIQLNLHQSLGNQISLRHFSPTPYKLSPNHHHSSQTYQQSMHT